jgi:hypothetical protein
MIRSAGKADGDDDGGQKFSYLAKKIRGFAGCGDR